MKLKLLLSKHRGYEVGAIYCKNSLRMVTLEKRLYGDYFLTSLGIFKFKFQGYYRSMKIYYCVVVLPISRMPCRSEN